MQEAAAFTARTWPLAEVLRLAHAILAGAVAPIEGSIGIAALAHDVVLDWSGDPDFAVFGAVASEMDDVPFGEVRSRWGAGALALADAKIVRYTDEVRSQVLAACRNVIARFDGAETRP
ncbi:MAG: DUF2489 domain-containing protein [Cyanobacteria bacterium SZAS LIN-2]|nr:DUF2489 domain-containing protein [Cyanobacteria bacterium SZAS LIN-2]